jgi:hypothetical protein
VKANGHFGGTYRLHFQGDLRATCFHAGFLLGLFFDPKMEAIYSLSSSLAKEPFLSLALPYKILPDLS